MLHGNRTGAHAVESGVRRALAFPSGSVAHLVDGTRPGGEMAALAALEAAGLPLGLLALPSAVEDSFYRYNNLPRRLAALYRDVDPADPDEDLLEEAEGPATSLVGQAHLLDEVIDGIYQGLKGLPAALVVRRPDDRRGLAVTNGRPVLLALKRQFRNDWTAEAVFARLLAGSGIGVEARPLLVHERAAPGPDAAAATKGPAGVMADRFPYAAVAIDREASVEASRILGRQVEVSTDGSGAVLSVQAA